METTEQQIIKFSREIGEIASATDWNFAADLARLYDNSDDRFLDAKISDFLSVLREFREDYNRVHGTAK